MNEAQGMSQDQGTSPSPGVVSSQPSQTSSAPSSAPSSNETVHEERTFRQSEVNSLIGREKARAIEEYRRQQAEQPHYIQQKYGEPAQQQAPTQSQAPLTSETEIRRLAAEEAQRFSDQRYQEAQKRYEAEAAQKVVQSFWNKVAPGKEKYSDFDAVTGDIEYARFPNVVQLLAEHVDNSHDMLYELGKDRGKMATLEQLAYMSPKDAIRQAQRMSQSLKDNETASKTRTPNEPLSQMRPSNTGTDNGVMGVSDYRRKWKV
jgi:hypothetical protein